MKNVTGIFKALADPTRLRIVLLLRRRELCVCEIMYVLGMEQSRISHQMRILRNAGLAEDRRHGRWIVYRVPGPARPLLEDLLSGALGARIDKEAGLAADALKLETCLRENVRRVCLAPKAPASRLPAGPRGADPERPSDKKTRKGKRS